MDAPTAQAILDKLDVLTRKVDALDERLDGLERRVDALPDGLSWTLDALDRKITVVIRNAPRRSMNIYAYHDTCQLAPMLSVLTGEPMDGFPETPAHLDRLEEPVVDHLLTHLGHHDRLGEGLSLVAKRRHLRHALGSILKAI
ncbi:hypothetical protein G6O67_004194 [Ophiocordyceps sinensis]|uniref:Uncharacterized protein n=1 Tax=Ophiocordyceps sinensis TaxID=72228 RepID=A0A8H4PMM1_9HYPO|nr:hypothetical protein G6O67_004194 [Ophiocordyceps sinensis]